jgi:hypothetical protein
MSWLIEYYVLTILKSSAECYSASCRSNEMAWHRSVLLGYNWAPLRFEVTYLRLWLKHRLIRFGVKDVKSY